MKSNKYFIDKINKELFLTGIVAFNKNNKKTRYVIKTFKNEKDAEFFINCLD